MQETEYNLHKQFSVSEDSELCINDCGYNDFNGLKSWNSPRVFDRFSVHVVLSGEGMLTVDGNDYNLRGGDMFFITRGETVNYYPSEKSPWRYYWLNFSGSKAQAYCNQMSITAKNAVRKCDEVEEYQLAFNEILSSNAGENEAYYKAVALFFNILSHFTDNVVEQKTINESGTVKRIKDIISLNYHDSDFSVQTISQMIPVSHSYMCKIFKEKTGTTIIKYLSNYRLDKAAQLLIDGKYTVKELADKCGYSDEFHFMKEFKKKFGSTVKRFRVEY